MTKTSNAKSVKIYFKKPGLVGFSAFSVLMYGFLDKVNTHGWCKTLNH